MAEDGKLREIDCANTRDLFRVIRSIPSKRAESFKQWLAKLGQERAFCFGSFLNRTFWRL